MSLNLINVAAVLASASRKTTPYKELGRYTCTLLDCYMLVRVNVHPLD